MCARLEKRAKRTERFLGLLCTCTLLLQGMVIPVVSAEETVDADAYYVVQDSSYDLDDYLKVAQQQGKHKIAIVTSPSLGEETAIEPFIQSVEGWQKSFFSGLEARKTQKLSSRSKNKTLIVKAGTNLLLQDLVFGKGTKLKVEKGAKVRCEHVQFQDGMNVSEEEQDEKAKVQMENEGTVQFENCSFEPALILNNGVASYTGGTKEPKNLGQAKEGFVDLDVTLDPQKLDDFLIGDEVNQNIAVQLVGSQKAQAQLKLHTQTYLDQETKESSSPDVLGVHVALKNGELQLSGKAQKAGRIEITVEATVPAAGEKQKEEKASRNLQLNILPELEIELKGVLMNWISETAGKETKAGEHVNQPGTGAGQNESGKQTPGSQLRKPSVPGGLNGIQMSNPFVLLGNKRIAELLHGGDGVDSVTMATGAGAAGGAPAAGGNSGAFVVGGNAPNTSLLVQARSGKEELRDFDKFTTDHPEVGSPTFTITPEGSGLHCNFSQNKVEVSGTPDRPGEYEVVATITDGKRTAKSKPKKFKIFDPRITFEEILKTTIKNKDKWECQPHTIAVTGQVVIPNTLKEIKGSDVSGTYGVIGHRFGEKPDYARKNDQDYKETDEMVIPAGTTLTLKNMKILASTHVIVEKGATLIIEDSGVYGPLDVYGTLSAHMDSAIMNRALFHDGSVMKDLTLRGYAHTLGDDVQNKHDPEDKLPDPWSIIEIEKGAHVRVEGKNSLLGDLGKAIADSHQGVDKDHLYAEDRELPSQTALALGDGATLTLAPGAELRCRGGGEVSKIYNFFGGNGVYMGSGSRIDGDGTLYAIGGIGHGIVKDDPKDNGIRGGSGISNVKDYRDQNEKPSTGAVIACTNLISVGGSGGTGDVHDGKGKGGSALGAGIENKSPNSILRDGLTTGQPTPEEIATGAFKEMKEMQAQGIEPDPELDLSSPKFHTDYDEQGRPTYYLEVESGKELPDIVHYREAFKKGIAIMPPGKYKLTYRSGLVSWDDLESGNLKDESEVEHSKTCKFGLVPEIASGNVKFTGKAYKLSEDEKNLIGADCEQNGIQLTQTGYLQGKADLNFADAPFAPSKNVELKFPIRGSKGSKEVSLNVQVRSKAASVAEEKIEKIHAQSGTLDAAERKQIEEHVQKAYPDAQEILVAEDGQVTLTFADQSKKRLGRAAVLEGIEAPNYELHLDCAVGNKKYINPIQAVQNPQPLTLQEGTQLTQETTVNGLTLDINGQLSGTPSLDFQDAPQAEGKMLYFDVQVQKGTEKQDLTVPVRILSQATQAGDRNVKRSKVNNPDQLSDQEKQALQKEITEAYQNSFLASTQGVEVTEQAQATLTFQDGSQKILGKTDLIQGIPSPEYALNQNVNVENGQEIAHVQAVIPAPVFTVMIEGDFKNTTQDERSFIEFPTCSIESSKDGDTDDTDKDVQASGIFRRTWMQVRKSVLLALGNFALKGLSWMEDVSLEKPQALEDTSPSANSSDSSATPDRTEENGLGNDGTKLAAQFEGTRFTKFEIRVVPEGSLEKKTSASHSGSWHYGRGRKHYLSGTRIVAQNNKPVPQKAQEPNTVPQAQVGNAGVGLGGTSWNPGNETHLLAPIPAEKKIKKYSSSGAHKKPEVLAQAPVQEVKGFSGWKTLFLVLDGIALFALLGGGFFFLIGKKKRRKS